MALGERAVTTATALVGSGQNRVPHLCIRALDEVTKDVEARGWWFQNSRGTIIGLSTAPQPPDWQAAHPEEFRRYVTIRAARILQTRYITDETLHKLTLEEEMYSKAVLEAKDAEEDSSVTFALPQDIENLGVRGVMFLQSNLEEKLATLKLGTELAQTELLKAQELKVDSEKLLIDAQELLVDQQKLTEVQNTTKTQRESELLSTQAASVGADVELKQQQSRLTSSQELKTDAEKLLVDAQATKTTAEADLIADQEALVTQQALTEAQETTKVLREGELLSAQTSAISADIDLKQQQSNLTASQELKTDAEKLLVDKQATKTEAESDLIADQEALVTQQLQTEINETSKRLSEKELVDAQTSSVSADIDLKQQQSNLTASQELKTDSEKLLVDAQAALTADQEAKTVAEKEILESQKTKLDAETAYMITAEKNWFDTGGVDISGTVRSYKDFRPEMRIMGIQEAAFQSLPAYKKVELIKDANQLRSDRASSDTATNIVASVNKILRYLGVNKVSSNTNEHALASEARDLLLDTDTELQARGWWFNTEKDVTFTITSGTIRVTPNTQLYEELDDYPTARVVDGAYIVLKNLKDNTVDQFSGTIKGTRVVKRSIEELEVPQKYREYLEVKVASTLAELYPQSGSEIQRLQKLEAELESYFKDRENDQGNYNIFDNYDTNERIGFNRNYDLN